ncbi:RDD family protein [compost metagenome]
MLLIFVSKLINMENQKNTISLNVEKEMYGTGWQRFANYLIDVVAFYLIIFILGIFAALLTWVGIDEPVIWLAENENNSSTTILSVVLFLFYYFIFEALGQRTLGKLVTGTKVVLRDGSKPSAGDIALRCLCRIIPFDAFSFIAERSRGWHDSLPNTYVIDVKKYKQALEMKNSFELIGTEQV